MEPDADEVALSKLVAWMLRHEPHAAGIERDAAAAVGARRGRAVVLQVDSGRMHGDGFEFLVTPNRVWLTRAVPPQYVREDPDA